MNFPIYPPQLFPKDKVALISPASPVSPDTLNNAVNSIKSLGITPVVFPSCKMTHGYLSGSDLQRAKDINKAFSSNEIKGIFCLRGGYGCMRILPMIDFESIKQNPKLFLGFSDITALHTAINKFCNLVTFHGPMPSIDYNRLDEFSLQSLKSVIFGRPFLNNAGNTTSSDKKSFNDIRYIRLQNPQNHTLKTLYPGNISGTLTGGNLTVLASTLGTPYEMDTTDKILFLEDVGETPYRIDRALTALALAGKFNDCRGVILGTFSDCFPKQKFYESKTPEPFHVNLKFADITRKTNISNSLSLMEIIEEVILPYKKPVVMNLQAGHTYPQLTLPMGGYIVVSV